MRKAIPAVAAADKPRKERRDVKERLRSSPEAAITHLVRPILPQIERNRRFRKPAITLHPCALCVAPVFPVVQPLSRRRHNLQRKSRRRSRICDTLRPFESRNFSSEFNSRFPRESPCSAYSSHYRLSSASHWREPHFSPPQNPFKPAPLQLRTPRIPLPSARQKTTA